MLRYALITIGMFWLSTSNCYARSYHTDWICSQLAATRSEDFIQTCGVGEGLSESNARAASLTAAKHEFQEICRMDASCRDQKIVLEPKRNECEHDDETGQWKCWRMIVWKITEVKEWQ